MNGIDTYIKIFDEMRVETDNVYKNEAYIKSRDPLISYNVCLITKDEK